MESRRPACSPRIGARGPGRRRGLVAPGPRPWNGALGRLEAALLPSLVPLDTKRHYWGGVIWSSTARPPLCYAWLSGPTTCPLSPHPPAITVSFFSALWTESLSRVIGPLHLRRPLSFAEGQSRESCFDAEIASHLAWTHHLSIFNCLSAKILASASLVIMSPLGSCGTRLRVPEIVYFSFIVKYWELRSRCIRNLGRDFCGD